MGDVIILKAAKHVDDSVRLTDVSKKLITQALALGGAFHQSGNVDYLTGGRHNAARMHQFGQLSQPLVGHGNDADIGFYRTKGEIGSLCLGTTEAVEQSRLAYIRQSYYTTF